MYVLSALKNNGLDPETQKFECGEHSGRTCADHNDGRGIMDVKQFRKTVRLTGFIRLIDLNPVTPHGLATGVDAATRYDARHRRLTVFRHRRTGRVDDPDDRIPAQPEHSGNGPFHLIRPKRFSQRDCYLDFLHIAANLTLFPQVVVGLAGKEYLRGIMPAYMERRPILSQLLALLLPLCLILVATEVKAQKIMDSGFRIVANIKSDGTIQDASFRTIGYIKSDGKIQDASFKVVGYLRDNGSVQDASFRTVGYIKDDGKIQDSSFRVIGYVKKDGLIQDSSFRTIGYAKDIPLRWAAFYFFFRK